MGQAACSAHLQPRYNIAPTQQVLTIRQREGLPEAVELRWGLIPSWADDPMIGIRARGNSPANEGSELIEAIEVG